MDLITSDLDCILGGASLVNLSYSFQLFGMQLFIWLGLIHDSKIFKHCFVPHFFFKIL